MRKIKASELVFKQDNGVEFNWELYNELPKYRQEKLLKRWKDWYAHSIYEAEENLGCVLFNDEDYEEFGDENGDMPEDISYSRLIDYMSCVEPFSEIAVLTDYYTASYFIEPNWNNKCYLGGIFKMGSRYEIDSDDEV